MMIEVEPFQLDISKLLSGEVKEIPFDFEPEEMNVEENQMVISSLRFFGQAYDLSGFPRLSGTITGVIQAACARCLAPVEETFSVEVDLSIATGSEESQEESILAVGQKIDLGSYSRETVFTNLPFRILCKEDCLGLCPRCGKDLNTGDCGCRKKEVDPRLAGLADFFKD
jgi:uncharacterized protein